MMQEAEAAPGLMPRAARKAAAEFKAAQDRIMSMRAIARRLRDGARQSVQRRVLQQSLVTLERTLQSGRPPAERLMEQLVYGWGNEAWSADASLLLAILEWLPRTTGPIAECGSGLSTLILACSASMSGRTVHSFEHDPMWAERVLHCLPLHLRANLSLHLTPIRSYGEFDWYSLDDIRLPPSIGFVLCDGPPGGTHGGRYGLAPLLQSHLAPGCLVLLDDTQRPGEHEIIRRWGAESDASLVHEDDTFSVLSMGPPGAAFSVSATPSV
jgi:hypothetical protein